MGNGAQGFGGGADDEGQEGQAEAVTLAELSFEQARRRATGVISTR